MLQGHINWKTPAPSLDHREMALCCQIGGAFGKWRLWKPHKKSINDA
jgi:hypothetical protein